MVCVGPQRGELDVGHVDLGRDVVDLGLLGLTPAGTT